ncbi:Endonuclease/exonuclease/phosphatase [Xylariaceae sp. FL0016]|nr:Endonuclease/exonuclease/phosphatase [Xylariaceae sp. FL0016]
MDEIIHNAIKRNEEMKKPLDSVPWTPDQPHPQSYYEFDSSARDWKPITNAETPSSSQLRRLALYSWNIDFMLPFDAPRMEAALAELKKLVGEAKADTAIVIYLQECVVPDLATIGEQAWVRENFYVTDVDSTEWASGYYGTTTLIDRRLPVADCFRVHYQQTRMERDAFFVDVLLGKNADRKVRLCNTHLESLAFDPPFRPPQMEIAARFMKDDGLHGAMAAGDFNAIQDFDRTLHSNNGLKDAYLELGGKEDSDEGYTWGQQAATNLRDRFGCSRMDKVYYHGGLKLEEFQRFGADVQLIDPQQKQRLADLGFEKPWITDHLGVMAEVSIVE